MRMKSNVYKYILVSNLTEIKGDHENCTCAVGAEGKRPPHLFSVRSPLTDEMCISLSLSGFNASSSRHNMILAERRIKASTRRERQRRESVNIHACRFKARPRIW